MSRKLKFRIWANDYKEWFSGDGMVIKDGNLISTGIQNLEIEQYTGLKDKNGKEIYEGDIVGVYEQQQYNRMPWFELDNIWEALWY